MPAWMPSWGSTALIAVVTSLLTLIVSGRYVSPLLEVRNRRFQRKMQVREELQADMIMVLGSSFRLLDVPVPLEAPDVVREALRGERVRWRSQIDEATQRLIDRCEQVAFAYGGSRTIIKLVVRYCANARMVWLSARSEECKLRALRDATRSCHALLFDSPLYIVQRVRSAVELEQMLQEMEIQTTRT